MPNRRPTREDGDEQPPGVEDIGSDSDSEYEEPIDIEGTNGTNPIEPEKSKTQTKGRSASRANKPKGKPKYPCPKCDKNCTSGSIQCRVCDQWYHSACADVTAKLLSMFNEAISQGHDHCWACSHCSTVFKKLNQKVTLLSKELDNIRAQGDRTEGRVEVLEKHVDNITKDLKSVKTSSEGGAQVKDDIYAEMNDREARKNNLLVHNVSESCSEDSRERKNHDSRLVCELFEHIGIKCDPDRDFKFINRVGAKNNDKLHPIIVGFRVSQTRDSVLNSAYKLRKAHDKDLQEVRIIPDLTKKQRELDERVSKDIDKRNAELEKSGDRSYHWRLVGQRGARTMTKVGGERTNTQQTYRFSRKRRMDQERSGETPPSQRMALSR